MSFEGIRKLFHFNLSPKEGPILVVLTQLIKFYFLTLGKKKIEDFKKHWNWFTKLGIWISVPIIFNENQASKYIHSTI